MLKFVNALGVFAATLSILSAGDAAGQGFGGGRSGSNLSSGLGFGGGGGGASSFGSGIGQGGVGQGGLGQGGLGQGGFGQGGLGQGGLGQGGLGQSGFGGATGFGQSASGFVGRDSADVTSMFEDMTRQGQQFMNRAERSMNRNRGRETDTSNEQAQQKVRVQLKIGFDYPDPATSPMTLEFANRMISLVNNRDVANVAFDRDGSNVTISGQAANDWERQVVEQLVSQQPGVTTVTNQMTVAEPIAAPTPQE